jgi:hypothetical protein
MMRLAYLRSTIELAMEKVHIQLAAAEQARFHTRVCMYVYVCLLRVSGLDMCVCVYVYVCVCVCWYVLLDFCFIACVTIANLLHAHACAPIFSLVTAHPR